MKKLIKISLIALISVVAFSANAFSEKVALNGLIKGASCVINKTYCPENSSDPHIALEKTFVLVDNAGGYFFLSNLGKVMQIALLNKPIHVEGNKKGKTLFVEAVYEAENDRKKSIIWSWANIKKKMQKN